MSTHDSYSHLEPVPPEPQSQEESPYRIGERLYLPESAQLPMELCVCCGRPAIKSVRKAVRSPRNPLTWYTRRPVLEVGLCKKHSEDNSVAITLTYSFFAIGVILLATGGFTLHFPTLIIGGLMAVLSGVFRARKPIWGTLSNGDEVCLRGIADRYLVQIPQRDISL